MTSAHDSLFDRLLDAIGRGLADKLNRPSSGYRPYMPMDSDTLRRSLLPGDVLLVEGREHISNAIKYLTQSTWSHAALYVGDALPLPENGAERPRLVEVNLGEGCVVAPLSKYESHNTRICRPSGLSAEERAGVVDFMVARIGLRYDMRNIVDLARYFMPTPPVPVRWRRRMLALGSGDPTRAICSSLIAQAFHEQGYPVLPDVEDGHDSAARREIRHIRHHTLFTPRDFDLSPWFEIVKPAIAQGLDPRDFSWERKAERVSA